MRPGSCSLQLGRGEGKLRCPFRRAKPGWALQSACWKARLGAAERLLQCNWTRLAARGAGIFAVLAWLRRAR
jgi:hypothetical protein